jgi:hypothetical protein
MHCYTHWFSCIFSSSDINGSKECEYTDCDYKCDSKIDENLTEDDLITDTYNLYYAESEIESIVTVIKDMFRKKFSYDISEILNRVSSRNLSSMVIIRALKYIIDKSIQLKNRYGMTCYLREDNNLYFLVDEITLPNSFLLAQYAEKPNIKRNYNFDDIIKLSHNNYIEDKIDIMENFDPDDEEDKN